MSNTKIIDKKVKSMGKAYFNKKPKQLRPKLDLYDTPMSLVWTLKDKFKITGEIYEPACGNKSIVKALQPCKISYTDITQGNDFLKCDKIYTYDIIITNPPFYLWDDFVFKAKELKPLYIIFIGRLNYFGCNGRSKSGIWNNLKYVYIFNRMVDYRTPYREDGLFHVGGMVTGWFIWKKDYIGEPVIKQLDIQKYAKLGGY
jgi:hypothetical protein